MHTRPPVLPKSSFRSAGRSSDGTGTRILKTMPAMEPLPSEKRYVQPMVSHVSVFTGLFAWAIRQDRMKKNARSPFILQQQSLDPRAIHAGGSHARGRLRFNRYFALGISRDFRPMDNGPHLNIHRNRLIFLTALAVVGAYTLIWMRR